MPPQSHKSSGEMMTKHTSFFVSNKRMLYFIMLCDSYYSRLVIVTQACDAYKARRFNYAVIYINKAVRLWCIWFRYSYMKDCFKEKKFLVHNMVC